MIFGHEASGIVLEIGDDVRNVKPGDHVVMEPTLEKVHGMTSQRYVHYAEKTHKLPDQISLKEGALCEPWAICVHAVRISRLKQGDRVLVIGPGPIGMLSALAARYYGASFVALTGTKDSRLSASSKVGAYFKETLSVVSLGFPMNQ